MAFVDSTTGSGVGIRLYWLPLGAGGRVVRPTGIVFETIVSRLASRRRLDLYHAALEVHASGTRFVIEVMPFIWGAEARACCGVVAEGPVGSPLAGRLGLFRYELRCWQDGVIADVEHAVASPADISGDAGAARRILDLVPSVPMCAWGRDELGAGEMWTSNSVISWLIARAGVASPDLHPPPGGRAPGWEAGLRIARQDGLVAGVPCQQVTGGKPSTLESPYAASTGDALGLARVVRACVPLVAGRRG
jgi:hypothetical protein